MGKGNFTLFTKILLNPCLAGSAFCQNLKGRIPPYRGGKIERLLLEVGLAVSSVEQPDVGGIRSDNLSTFFGFRSFFRRYCMGPMQLF